MGNAQARVRIIGLSSADLSKAQNLEKAMSIHNNLLKEKDKMPHLEDIMTYVSGIITKVIREREFDINTNGPVQRLLTAHPAPEVHEGQYVRAYFLKASHAHYKEISRGRLVDGKLALLARDEFNDTEQPYKICLVETLSGKEIEPPLYFDEHFDPAEITSV
jgi:hypothetical protein